MLEFLGYLLGGMSSDLSHEFLVHLRDHLFNGVHNLVSDVLHLLV